MEVILLEKIRNLGNVGDTVSIKAGFARNYLIPQKKAVSATAENIKKFESRRAELLKKADEVLHVAQERATKLTNFVVTISARAQEDGKLFGSLGTLDLSHAITEAGVSVEKSEIRLPMGPLRAIGEYEILVQLHADVGVPVKIVVVAEA